MLNELRYYNAGERPTVEILYRHPQLVHRVKGDFGIITDVSLNLYRNTSSNHFDWRSLDSVHLLVNHRFYRKNIFNYITIDVTISLNLRMNFSR